MTKELKNIYTYLDKINFEEEIKEKAELYRKVSNSDNPLFSDFVILQHYFSILQKFFEEIYKDVNE